MKLYDSYVTFILKFFIFELLQRKIILIPQHRAQQVVLQK